RTAGGKSVFSGAAAGAPAVAESMEANALRISDMGAASPALPLAADDNERERKEGGVVVHVGTRTFYRVGESWIDAAYDKTSQTRKVELFSEAYFELLRKHRSDLAGDEHDGPLRLAGEHLGFHSLAVALAASYLWKHKSASPADLLDRLQRADVGDEAHLLADLDPTEHTAGYKSSVAQSLSLHLPDFADTPAMALLGLAAFCHPDRIPVDVFFENMKLPKEEVEKWLVRLDQVSIVRFGGQTISLHRLMQDVFRGGMDEDFVRSALTELVGFLTTRFEDANDYRNWSMQDEYAAHAEAALASVRRMPKISGVGHLGNQFGVYLRERARFDAALAGLRAAEGDARAAYGNDHPNVAATVDNIGAVLKAKGDLDGALKYLREAERIVRAAYSDDDSRIAKTLNNIGTVLEAMGEFDGALEYFRDAERINRVAYGDDHPEVAANQNNIGSVLAAKGDLEGALICHRQAERIHRAAYDKHHPSVALAVNNIGSVLHDKGDLDGALKCFCEAERTDRAAYGEEHPVVARDVNNIGMVLMAKGDLEGALKCFHEAEHIDRGAYGDDHPDLAADINNIGAVLKAKGDLEGASKCYSETERINRAAYGDQHPAVARAVNNMGCVLLAMGDVEGATSRVSEAFGVILSSAGPRALNTIQFAKNLKTVGVDPIPLAREIAGDEAANQLEEALRNRPSE
ncbi:MAG: tetratricopeptide repeat protein, partial [Planctomycetes bacterium]|nr:tetratricopeptide repeat protein [Planctomycetota bacterium]